MAVPTPKPSRGAPDDTSASISYSSRLPLAMIWMGEAGLIERVADSK